MTKIEHILISSVVCQSHEILSNAVDMETVLLNIEKNSYYGMGAVASHIWQLIAKPTKVTDLVSQLMQHYEIEFYTCQHDVINFLNQLSKERLIVVDNQYA